MASVFLYHVIGDLTCGKPDLVEFCENETIESAIRVIGESTEGGIPVWKRRQHKGVNLVEDFESRQQRFVGILNSLDVVEYLAREECLKDQEKALRTPVAEVVVPNNLLLKEVDAGTRLIDALEIMKQGVRRLIVPKTVGWKGMSRRFSIIYNGKWLKNINTSTGTNNLATSSNNRPSFRETKFCCLSREDVVRFLIGCLGALAPLPLSSISTLNVVNFDYRHIEASSPAIEITPKHPPTESTSAVAVIEFTSEGQHKIIGEISASKLWKCDYMAAAWALANLSSGQFVMGVEENTSPLGLPDFPMNSIKGDPGGGSGNPRPRKFSSRNIGFLSNPTSSSLSMGRSMYRGRSAPLTCKVTSSLAAVMAQMLSHRATHVWVTEAENEEILVGVVGYVDILAAVTRHPATLPQNP